MKDTIGTLEDNLVKICGMFSDNFQNILFTYHILKIFTGCRGACYRVVPWKVSIRDWDKMEEEFTKEELFVSLSWMKTWKSLGFDGPPCEFYYNVGCNWRIFCILVQKVNYMWIISKFLI